MSHQTESHQNDPLGALWIAAVAAVGLGAAALLLLRRRSEEMTRRGIDDLVNLCDDAARVLDDRVMAEKTATA